MAPGHHLENESGSLLQQFVVYDARGLLTAQRNTTIMTEIFHIIESFQEFSCETKDEITKSKKKKELE